MSATREVHFMIVVSTKPPIRYLYRPSRHKKCQILCPAVLACLRRRSRGDVSEGESQARIDVFNALLCGPVFVRCRWRNLGRAGSESEPGSKIALVLHDDFQHLGQAGGVIIVA